MHPKPSSLRIDMCIDFLVEFMKPLLSKDYMNLLESSPPAIYFWKLLFGRFLATIKTLGFLRLTRLSPDLRIQKNDAFLFSSTGLRVPHYIFLGKYGFYLVKTIQ